MNNLSEAFRVTPCTDEDGEYWLELEVLFGQFEGRRAYVDCWHCAMEAMRLVLTAEGLDPETITAAPDGTETLH